MAAESDDAAGAAAAVAHGAGNTNGAGGGPSHNSTSATMLSNKSETSSNASGSMGRKHQPPPTTTTTMSATTSMSAAMQNHAAALAAAGGNGAGGGGVGATAATLPPIAGGANGLLLMQPTNNNAAGISTKHQHPPPPPPQTQRHHGMEHHSSHNFYHSPPDRRDMPPHLLSHPSQHQPQGGGAHQNLSAMSTRSAMGAAALDEDENDGLGPLPPKWEKAYTENGESYFIDHNTGTSHWLDPRLSKFQKKSLEDCQDDELPYGWEKIHDPQYGTYFIDHVNRRTQYENPVLEAKRRAERQREPPPLNHGLNGSAAGHPQNHHHQQQQQRPPPGSHHHQHHSTQPLPSPPGAFTRNPTELCGERLTTTLLKSSRGLGFTIVGGDDNVDEFLQIKSIVPNGPAWLDGKLLMGDILVYVNDTCVLGFSHHEMVNVFQSIQPGETVTLEICRGYPLPFDPNDPNTEVVTTIAVDGLSSTDPDKVRILMDFNIDGNYNFLDTSDASAGGIGQKNPLAKLTHLQSGNASVKSDGGSEHLYATSGGGGAEPEILNIAIVKGAAMGFGFTIADSAYGQKVKKILDSNCCTKLVEGDYLLAINNINVKHMSHAEVVQVLKHCPKGHEAVLKIQRGHFVNGSALSGANAKGAARLRRSGDRFGTMPMGGAPMSMSAASSNAAGGKDGKFTGGGGGMFRSKTPTADLYSTQTKEILPVRPKTPLVDTRGRAKTPSAEQLAQMEHHPAERLRRGSFDELDKGNGADDGKSADGKSNNSMADHDSINNDIPYMDPYPKMVGTLSERLSVATLNGQSAASAQPPVAQQPAVDPHSLYSYPVKTRHLTAANQPEQQQQQQQNLNASQQDYYSNGGVSAAATSGTNGGVYHNQQHHQQQHNAGNGYHNNVANGDGNGDGGYMPIMAPVPTYHHESCYCYECQDYGRHQQEYALATQYQQYATTTSTGSGGGRNQKRIQDYMIDRRKAAGFSPLEVHQQQQQHHQQQQMQMQQQHQHQQMMHTQQQQQQQMQMQAGGAGGALAYWKYGGVGAPVGQGSPGSGHGVVGGVAVQEEYSLSEVTLERQQLGFGFRIVGGTEEGSQVTVGHIVPGGAADGDARIATGDEILSIDGHNVVQGSHHRVVQLMGEAALRGQVTMILRRKVAVRQMAPVPMANGNAAAAQAAAAAVRYPYDVIVSRNENEGFGFVISSSQYYGSTIGKLIPGSPADRCEDLKVDDRIIAVNRVDINGMSHGDVVNLIKDSGLHVRLTIGNPKDAQMLGGSANLAGMQPHTVVHQPLNLQQQQQQQHQQQQHGVLASKNESYYDGGYAMVGERPGQL